MNTPKQNLLDYIQTGIEAGINYITLVVSNEEMIEPELITNPKENFEYKKNYIDKAYNDNLELKTYNKIKITDYYYSDASKLRLY